MKKIIKVISISTLMLLFFALNMMVDKTEEKEINYKGLAMTIDGEVVEELPTEGYYYLNSTCEGGNLTWDIYNRTLKLKGDGSLNYSSCKLDFESIDLKIYISGVESNTLPTTEGYSVSSNCGGATVTYAYPNLNITATENPGTCEIYFDINLKGKILADNNEQSDAGISFGSTSAAAGTNGLYYTSDTTKTENGEVVYYYRGAVTNNYVVFGNYCWRIVRTVEDGSVRLRYGGTPTQSGNTYTCPQTGQVVNIALGQPYNASVSNKNDVNYKVGSIKTIVENWYKDNIAPHTSLTNLIADTPYCNDISEPKSGFFGAYDRLHANKSPQYKCASSTYAYTVAKGDLTYPVAILTADEVAYAGGVYEQSNSSYYLYTGEHYWTMSLYSFAGGRAFVLYVDSSGKLSNYYSGNSRAVVPVVSLISEASVLRGTGAYNDPYVIITN